MSVIYVLKLFFNANSMVMFVYVCLIRVTIYGKSAKHVSVIYVLKLFFNANSMVMFVLLSE